MDADAKKWGDEALRARASADSLRKMLLRLRMTANEALVTTPTTGKPHPRSSRLNRTP
jgi:hypothetical protein